MNVLFENVKLGFTNCMTRESDYGAYNYSFIIDKDKFCETVRDTLALQKKPVWDAKKNTDEFILEKCNAKKRDDVKHEKVQSMMSDSDILIDVFEFEYGKRQFICIRSHASRGCTVKVKELVEYKNTNYFDFEDGSENGVALDNINEYVNDEPSNPF